MTRLGDFWKFLETNVTLKLAQILGNFLGDFEVSQFLSKNYFAYLLGIYCKFWFTFNSDIWSHWLLESYLMSIVAI